MKSISKSDGLGGFSGVSNTLRLGTDKRITHNKFHIMFMRILVTVFQSNNAFFCISTILALQSSNEVHRRIHTTCHRYSNVPRRNISFTKTCVQILFLSVSTLWIFNIILLCGDVQLNPGPGSVEDSTNSSFYSSDSHFEMISNHLSILHLNVQNIVPKPDLIRSEADLYDILIFSESWVKSETQNETLYIENFQPPFRKDRRGRPGGGVLVYVRDTFSCKHRTYLELDGLEAVWIELSVKSKKS